MAELNPDDVELSPALQAQEAAETTPKGKAKAATETVDETVSPDGDTPEAAVAAADDASGADAVSDAEAGDPEATDEPEKAEKDRSKPASKRIAELTKARREAERRADELEARLARLEAGNAPANDTEIKKPDPADPKYEFGEADPEYILDAADYRAEQRQLARDAKAKAEAEQATRKAQGEALDASWQEKAAKAVEKYPDFQEKVIDAAANKEWDLLPLSAAAVQGSEVADDLAYHLATHPEDSKKLADAERGFHMARQAALQAGLSPEVANMMAAPHLMRGQEIFEGLEKQYKDAPAKPQGKIATDAPEPPSQRARGAGGQFTPDFSSDSCDLSALNKAIRG